MTTSVEHTIEVIGGKEYPMTVTRQRGLQEIEVDGVMVQVVNVTITESQLGKTRCYTRAQPEPTQEERTATLRQIKETATKAMVDMGIW